MRASFALALSLAAFTLPALAAPTFELFGHTFGSPPAADLSDLRIGTGAPLALGMGGLGLSTAPPPPAGAPPAVPEAQRLATAKTFKAGQKFDDVAAYLGEHGASTEALQKFVADQHAGNVQLFTEGGEKLTKVGAELISNALHDGVFHLAT